MKRFREQNASPVVDVNDYNVEVKNLRKKVDEKKIDVMMLSKIKRAKREADRLEWENNLPRQ